MEAIREDVDGFLAGPIISGNRLTFGGHNLANAKESREGFVTLSGTATATGGDGPITDSLFIAGYQLGCQTDLSTCVQYGGSAGFSPMADLGLLDPGVAGGLSGFVQTVLQPGVIVDLPLSNVALSKDGRAPRHS